MTGVRSAIGQVRGRAALALVAFALLIRLLVPAGWMPAAEGGYAITLCTSQGLTTAWVDEQGRIHKGEPGKAGVDHPCLFAGFAAALDAPLLAGALVAPLPAAILPPIAHVTVAIGRGLAAPPPPATGPPASL